MSPAALHQESASRTRASARRTHVSTIMTTDVVTVEPETSLEVVAELLVERGLSRLPVVDGNGVLKGVVGKTNLVEDSFLRGDDVESADPKIQNRRGISFELPGSHVEPSVGTANEVMARELITIRPDTTIAEAARIMATRQLHGLPVTNADGKLLGVVSALDLAAWIAGLEK